MLTLKQRLARLMPYFRNSRPALALAAAALVVNAATQPLIPKLLQVIIDRGFKPGAFPLWTIPAVVVSLFLVRGASGWVANYGLATAAQNAVLSMRTAMFSHLMRAAPAVFSRNTASSLTNGVVYEVQQGANQLMGTINTLLGDTLATIGYFGYLIYLDWQLTLFATIMFPATGYFVRIVGKRVRRLTLEGQSATDELAYIVEENVLAWRIVRLHAAAEHERGRFDEMARRMRRLTIKQSAAGSVMDPITQLLASLSLSAVLVMAIHQGGGHRTPGQFMAFITCWLLLIQPIKHLSDLMTPLTRGAASMERGIELIETVPAETGGTLAPQRVRGDIAFQDVGLRYGAAVPAAEGAPPQDRRPALSGVTLPIRAGETVAFVGPSGAGKTSLVNLLPRFLEPTEGRITLDGAPLADYDVGALRRQFALVSQDVVLFNDTVAANVALGDAIDLERVRDALAGANLLDFVLGMPGGLQARIGHNGSRLSGGQRQRLAIARAIYKDAPVLILDEATSALDSESERAVQAALEVLMKGRTTLVIAHRLSTIEHADRVVAMDQGRIAEQGPHAELLAAGGLYARLHAMQFRGS
ncbi:MAG TPA: lipid A export permease/ATP-binding protein MsbA [Burkholderiaceae bacterium]